MKLIFSYSRTVYRDGRMWEIDEIHDFCCWLVEAARKHNFLDFYTVKTRDKQGLWVEKWRLRQ